MKTRVQDLFLCPDFITNRKKNILLTYFI